MQKMLRKTPKIHINREDSTKSPLLSLTSNKNYAIPFIAISTWNKSKPSITQSPFISPIISFSLILNFT